jgi:hypothetical protein
MTPHEAGCHRGKWLIRRRKEHGWTAMFWIVVFSEGPPCTCSGRADCSAAEQSDDGTGEAGEAPTGVNSQAGGASTG